MRATIVAALIAAACTGPALACVSPEYHSYSVLEALPAVGERETVVARVEIVALGTGDRDRMVDSVWVTVIEPIRGAEAGRPIRVEAQRNTMCVQRFHRGDIGRRGYIAGDIDPATGRFRGSWLRGQRVE